MPGRGHALTIDGGWREVADTALTLGVLVENRPHQLADEPGGPLGVGRAQQTGIDARVDLAAQHVGERAHGVGYLVRRGSPYPRRRAASDYGNCRI
jgi:hypothetical protein